ncbi:MAG TPA: hypothetical protein PKC40_02205 [Saprospiraceae bacterium]|nr:hypothetical protein [Saprospiraceae bacterium]
MKKILTLGLPVGLVLLLLSLLMLYVTVLIFPGIAEEYYNPMFRRSGGRSSLFFIHPFILSFALAWFWERFKGLFSGPFWLRGLEMGLVYGLVATIPSMWITFSAIDISLTMIASWLFYGLSQAMVAGILFARFNP